MSSDENTNPAPAPAPVPVSKWKDPDYIRKYYREKRREERGIKRHVNVLEDGRKWSDENPWGRFKTEEEFKEWKKSYQKPAPKRPKRKCEICQVEVYEAKWWIHEKSTDHVRNLALLQRHGYAQVIPPV